MTDYTDNDALMVLLSNLYNTFKEFKSHEEIENEYIMKRLKSRLREMKIHNSEVCNCHSDDQFSPLIQLVDSGYIFLDKQKSASEKINYGMQLRKALKEFVRSFLPHMKQEEEVFQPLLSQHFSENELMEMKTLVIKQHLLQHRKAREQHQQGPIKIEDKTKRHACSIDSLPNEILLKVFSYLKCGDLMRSSQVSRNWNLLAYEPSFYKHISFNEWKSKNNCNAF